MYGEGRNGLGRRRCRYYVQYEKRNIFNSRAHWICRSFIHVLAVPAGVTTGSFFRRLLMAVDGIYAISSSPS